MGMKSWPLSVLIAVGMASLISQLLSDTRAARFVDDYPLVCRGTETFKLDPEVPCEGCTKVNTEEPLRYDAFTFMRGSGPSGKGLNPGECSWLDRAMRPEEPNQLVQEIEGIVADERYAWMKELRSRDSYWIFNVHTSRGRLLASGSERGGKPVVSDRRLPESTEVKSPDLYIAEVKIIDLPPSPGMSRLAVRVGNKGTGDAGEVVLDLRRMRVCKDHPIPRSYRQTAVPALKVGQEEWIYMDGFDREWGSYITREGKNGSRLELVINPSDLYSDCTNATPVRNYAKNEKETANNTLAFDPRGP